MHRLRIVLLAAAGTAFAGGFRPVVGQRAPAGSCPAVHWSAPRPLVQWTLGNPRTSVARSPVIAQAEAPERASLWVVGMDLQALVDTGRSASAPFSLPLFVWHSATPASTLAGPAGSAVFAFPQAAVDSRSRGALHVVWAEPAAAFAGDYASAISHLSRLRWAAFAGGTWSAPATVLEATSLWWNAAANTGIVTDSAGTLHLVVVAGDSDHGPGHLVHLRFQNGSWQQRVVDGRGSAYAALAAGGAQTLLLAFIAPDTTQARDANSVFFTRSADAGATWAPAVLVSRSGAREASEVKVFAASGDTIHLIFSQSAGNGQPGVIRHVSSADGGRHWSASNDVRPPPGFRLVRAVQGPCGAIHVVYEDWNGGGVSGHLDYVRWDGHWSAPRHLFPALTSLSPELHAGGGGVRLVWLARPANRPGSPFVTMISRLTGNR